MKVMKFGGSSLANAQCFQQVAELITTSAKEMTAVVVLSAPQGMTDTLTHLISAAEEKQVISPDFEILENHLFSIVQNFNLPSDNCKNLLENLKQHFNQLKQWLTGIIQLGCTPDEIKAKIISLGEYCSVLIMHNLLKSKSIDNNPLNSKDYLVGRGDYLSAAIDLEVSRNNFSNFEKESENSIYLMQGFVASNPKGQLCLLGRNGSDYTAAAVAAILKAKSCEIWTDVDGVFETDPRQVSEAKIIKRLSYREAMEMSFFGAKVLHPKTIVPIAQFHIPCWIKNTFSPESPGTIIHQITDGDNKIKSLNYLEDVTVLTVSGVGMKGRVGMVADRVFRTVSATGCSVILITQSSSEYSISFCVPNSEAHMVREALDHEFHLEHQHKLVEKVNVRSGLAVISLVGDGMKNRKGTSAKFFTALAQANINVVAIAQGSSESSISAVIDSSDQTMALRSCYQSLFDTRRFIDVFLIGHGIVGGEFMNQLREQAPHLDQQGIGIRVRALVNSKRMLLDSNGINLSNWQQLIDQSTEEYDLEKLIKWSIKSHVVNPVIVDCTSSQDIADQYAHFLENGFHVVTPNKKANTMSYECYKNLRKIAQEKNRKFLYETNVGAGLPVIDNLKGLIFAGDKLITFEGILSGSLSYILGELDKGIPFSQIVKEAKEKGFTEPDPRDDLSGMDVARKLLIMAREAGYPLELGDINVESLLPENFNAGGSVEEFLNNLNEIDDIYSKKQQEAQACGKVLRYIGMLDQGQAKVSLQSVDKRHPLADVTGGNNALSLLTNYYRPHPLVIRGYGAGAAVTAAGVFSDLLKTLHWEMEGERL